MPTSALGSLRFPPSATLLCLALALGCGSSEDPPTEAAAEVAPTEAAAAVPDQATDGGEVVAISGPGGVESPALPAGAFLGKGGRLQVGQALQTPKGTLAELRLSGGIRVRMNEDTALTLPGADAASRLVLTRGEIVVLTEPESTAELAVAAGDEVLTIARGEAQVRSSGTARRFAVISGSASLQAPSRSLTLAPGESIDAPLPEEQAREPELSLAPLRETNWSRNFDAAARIAEEVPAGVGSLTARRPGSSVEKQRLRLTDQTVTVSIAGRIAHTEIEQAFFNDQPAVLEGTYRFPLPGDGSVSGLGLLVGNRWMEGEIVEKTRARQIFKSIVDATIPRDPALLEWERGNLFKLRVFPIPGRGERRVRLAYTQVLPVAGETLRYRFPMGGTGAGGTEIEHFDFKVTIDGEHLDEATLADIGTPMMELERKLEGSRVELSAARDHFIPTADIGVDIPLPEAEAKIHTETHLDRDGQAYFMVSTQPELELPHPEGPTSFAFVIDRSHSISPELWSVARGMVEAMATSMEPEDRFAVLACDTACDQAPGGLLSGQPGDLDEMRRFLDDQDLAGASDLGGMLVAASEALERGGATGERVIVYLGDGTPSSGEMAADQLGRLLAEPLRGTRVMAVAMGARSDLTTLGAVVRQTGGDVLQADPRDDRLALVRELRLRARVPAAHDLELELPDGMVAVHRMGGGGLRPGDSLVLVGKLSRPVHDEVVVRGRGPEGPIEARFRVDLEADRVSPVEHRHLPRTWAQAEIAHLTQTKGFDAKDEIVALSQHYTVMSRHTSLLVLENDAMYREFNVVRAAKNTDKWDGKLSESPDDASAAAGASTRTTTTTPPADDLRAQLKAESDESKPVEEEDDLAPAQPTAEPSTAVPGGVAGGVIGGELGTKGSGAERSRDHGEGGFDPDPFPASPSAADRGLDDDNREVSEDEPSDLELGDDGDDPAEPAAGGSSSGASRESKRKSSSSSSRPAPKSSKPKKDIADFDLDDPFALGGGGGWGPPGRGWRGPIRELKARPVASPDAGALARVESLRLAVDADPTQSSAHGKLVRAALRAGHHQSLDFARAWAEVDPDHAPALTSLADAMATDGDPLALRAYESALEVKPFQSRSHEELARAYQSKGDLRRACSHLQAVVSIDPKDGRSHAELARCLEREGRHREALDAVADGRLRATSETAVLSTVDRELATGAVLPAAFELHGGAELRLTLTWAGEGDLDLAVVDTKGQRLSGLHPAGKVRVREGSGREELTLKKVRKSVFVEVTRPTPTRAFEGERGTVHGELVVKTPHSTRRIPVSVREGTVRVAKAFWVTR
ncbi:MAG: FecR domain-containing protein [Myxococcales bacterium]|nr:FecR domain-containing protein [Myxococcales bacterium]